MYFTISGINSSVFLKNAGLGQCLGPFILWHMDLKGQFISRYLNLLKVIKACCVFDNSCILRFILTSSFFGID